MADAFIPDDISLPFFAYGVFQPGQLGFLRLKDLVSHLHDACANGALYERDGLPLFVPGEGRPVHGKVLFFREGTACKAYLKVAELEPRKVYCWTKISYSEKGNPQESKPRAQANVLKGRSPEKGSSHIDLSEWDGSCDPLFTTALDMVKETWAQYGRRRPRPNGGNTKDVAMRALFNLQMAYSLLWSSIERYAALRHGLQRGPLERIKLLAKERAFREALIERVTKPREVFDVRNPAEEKYVLEPGEPEGSIKYYFQVRCNSVHRGKGGIAASRDFEILSQSLKELLAIFRDVMRTAFDEAKWDGDV